MKKTYIAPEVEITRFNTEDIMAGSAITVAAADENTYNNSVAKVTVDYATLFNN